MTKEVDGASDIAIFDSRADDGRANLCTLYPLLLNLCDGEVVMSGSCSRLICCARSGGYIRQ